ncbi:PepSY-associated TM helix domain-containing protein [Sphingomonas nostoxanthinifaciens]|uniref:PepSY-associated TM helix domain-containing protein n=1 Tax=Sphingomonas nostoxanthinifaciens TaxID=2872652 RepID=UPI001CC2014A|nr:PepSY domain-containing protein [Sphingomonas nostoxanthinifaciens]UAK25248.1 PepSY domain-containing protein [Sphingomonas nostoxanthinifaciens]
MPPVSDRSSPRLSGAPLYRAIWRWHFYAGLFCIPFVIWLALTGSIYLWRPQIEAWLDRPYAHRAAAAPAASPDAQVAAALRAVPGGTLHKYVLPQTPDAAVRVLVTSHGADRRVYLDPQSLAVLGTVTEEHRPMRVLFHLHGELLAGAIGSYLVEIAACWAIVMLLTGLYLWWPRGHRGLAGLLYPRWWAGGRLFWRDLHASAGLWVSLFALGLILTGLPWANGWGNYLVEIRQLTGTSRGPVDWTIGGKPPQTGPMAGAHAGHDMMTTPPPPVRPGELARVIATVRPLGIAPPVLIAPPAMPGAPWSIASDAADRPLRSELKVDGATGRVVSRTDFGQRHWIDRVIGYGVAVHEGALFGLANQLLGTVTALLLILLAVSGAVIWWRRRPVGALGAPPASAGPRLRLGAGLIAAIGALALYLPLFGLTLILVLLFEAGAPRLMPGTARWLGLRPARPARR